jgi:hypothetical protein
LKRATIIGEPSGGGAHPFEYPITGGNWQGLGVQPDVRVAADKALEAALDSIRGEKIKGN